MSKYRVADLDLRFQKRIRLDESGCWIWAGTIMVNGYGMFSGYVNGVKAKWLAHRIVYEALAGAIPPGLCIDHLCRVRACVNPSHLEPVTLEENTRRGENWNRRKATCLQGHPFSPENTRLIRNGKYTSRSCQACARASRERRGDELRARRRAAYQENRNGTRDTVAAYRESNRERINAAARAYRAAKHSKASA